MQSLIYRGDRRWRIQKKKLVIKSKCIGDNRGEYNFHSNSFFRCAKGFCIALPLNMCNTKHMQGEAQFHLAIFILTHTDSRPGRQTYRYIALVNPETISVACCSHFDSSLLSVLDKSRERAAGGGWGRERERERKIERSISLIDVQRAHDTARAGLICCNLCTSWDLIPIRLYTSRKSTVSMKENQLCARDISPCVSNVPDQRAHISKLN